MKATLEQQISELRRELAMRQRVYPRAVQAGKMTAEIAQRQTQTLEDAITTLVRIDALKRLINAEFA